MPRLQFSLVILAQLSQRALGHVHLSPKHPNSLQLCNVAAHFLRLFPMILYFHISAARNLPLLCSLEARLFFYFKVYLKIELQRRKISHENTTGGWKVIRAVCLKITKDSFQRFEVSKDLKM